MTQEQPVPTKAELEALKILWQHGPSTVRFVHDLLTREPHEQDVVHTRNPQGLGDAKGVTGRQVPHHGREQ